ncbi:MULTISPECIES: hypothetical protein [Stutzerimonas]|mgnify:CR=1 FL=1|jgi:hypothetical protein|uniref:Uncharacterized protein n=1 Tax=Stutzerimonas balearica DSM 6083 TaxID=1123016 RepID=A0A8D3Y0K8_9GAMM|nr:hypothetical protein [Stutzerimonas balearica]MBB62029.1 hypothetical protein [Pseudomonas sp.]MBZ5755803.1 hypothetical protein [Pseudomonas sp. S5(2021)]AJE14894.1 hypothetical protein CL52_07480 [Stutzerimonas balearica DSM 6083]MBC7198948.1 hypothetical protein [Stutzerimonas balearica]MBD3735983.1 hypothetical protein [Stutzerimonas balearica]|tara:strand:+ start:572 stop:1825 length:1254 start_codon:yes stop_codon:yes gene_type:complete
MTTFSSRFLFFPLLFLAIVLHFSVFGESPHNPYGLKGINEAFLAICMVFAFLLILAQSEEASRELRILMYYCLYTVVVFQLLPAVFAYFTYGQPIVYGLIEERRVLFCLGFAPLLFLSKRVSTLQFERALIYAALFAAFLSWCFKFGVIPDMRAEVRSDDRPDRSSIGPFLICFGYFYCIQLWHKAASPINGAKRSRTLYLILAALLLLTLVFATQTRQLIVLCLAFTLFCLRAKAIVWAASLCVLLSPLYFYPSLLEVLGLNVDFYSQSVTNVEDGARPITIAAIMRHLDLVNWLPSGSLSLMWRDGFIPYFGEHFFLSDVGIVGTLFRFGFLTFLIIPLTLLVYQRIAKNIDRDLSFIYAVMLAYFVIWPLNGLMEYGQPVIAMLFVIHSLRARHLRSQERLYERRTYSQLQGSY